MKTLFFDKTNRKRTYLRAFQHITCFILRVNPHYCGREIICKAACSHNHRLSLPYNYICNDKRHKSVKVSFAKVQRKSMKQKTERSKILFFASSGHLFRIKKPPSTTRKLTFCSPGRYLLPCNVLHLALQKATFYDAKAYLLQRHRTCFIAHSAAN